MPVVWSDQGVLIETLATAFATAATNAGATVRVTGAPALVATLVEVLAGSQPVLVTPELEALAAELSAAGVDARVGTRKALGGTAPSPDDPLESALRRTGAGLTLGLCGVASSGSVALGPGGGNGGLLAALPPHHVAILRVQDILPSLGEAFALLADSFVELDGQAVFVTGPSRTADIEMMSVIGVHGPLRMDVVLIEDPPAGWALSSLGPTGESA